MTDKEILQMKLNLKDSILDEKEKEEFLTKVEQFTDVFSLRDEIGTFPFIEVHLKLKDETPFFVRPYPKREEQKKVIQKEMDRLEHLGIIRKGLSGYSSPVVLVKWKIQNLYRVCSVQEMDDTYTYESPNNYYYNAPSQSRGRRPYDGQRVCTMKQRTKTSI